MEGFTKEKGQQQVGWLHIVKIFSSWLSLITVVISFVYRLNLIKSLVCPQELISRTRICIATITIRGEGNKHQVKCHGINNYYWFAFIIYGQCVSAKGWQKVFLAVQCPMPNLLNVILTTSQAMNTLSQLTAQIVMITWNTLSALSCPL